MLNDFFEKIYCINLESRKDRWAQSQSEFSKHNLAVDRVPAILGSDLCVAFGGGVKPGAVGCSLSQFFVIKMAKQLGLKNFLLLEDDVEFDDDLQNNFTQAIADVPDDWDLLYLGGNHLSGQLQHIKNDVYRVGRTLAAHALAFRNSVYDLMLSKVIQIAKPCDVHYAESQPQLKAYALIPCLAWQKEGFSNIENMHVNYGYLKAKTIGRVS